MVYDAALFFSLIVGMIAAACIVILLIPYEEVVEGPEEDPEPEYHLNADLMYDRETIYRNCTVIVLENSKTGDAVWSWWKEERDDG